MEVGPYLGEGRGVRGGLGLFQLKNHKSCGPDKSVITLGHHLSQVMTVPFILVLGITDCMP